MERSIQLPNRLIGTREIESVEVFDIDKIEAHFKESIKLIENQLKVIDDELALPIIEEILRSQVVFIDSAFDYFMHEIIKLGIINMYNGDWEASKKFYKLEFDMKDVESARCAGDDDCWLRNWIDSKYATRTYMSGNRYIEVCDLLKIKINKPAGHEIKKKIDEVYSRRNLIAHQSDRCSATAERKSINQEDVNRYLTNILSVVNTTITKIKRKRSCE